MLTSGIFERGVTLVNCLIAQPWLWLTTHQDNCLRNHELVDPYIIYYWFINDCWYKHVHQLYLYINRKFTSGVQDWYGIGAINIHFHYFQEINIQSTFLSIWHRMKMSTWKTSIEMYKKDICLTAVAATKELLKDT